MIEKKIYPISLCAGGGNPEITLLRAVEILRQQGYNLEISLGERYEIDKDANDIAKTVLKATTFEKTTEMGSIVNFPGKAKRIRAKEDTLLLVFGGNPCTNIT